MATPEPSLFTAMREDATFSQFGGTAELTSLNFGNGEVDFDISDGGDTLDTLSDSSCASDKEDSDIPKSGDDSDSDSEDCDISEELLRSVAMNPTDENMQMLLDIMKARQRRWRREALARGERRAEESYALEEGDMGSSEEDDMSLGTTLLHEEMSHIDDGAMGETEQVEAEEAAEAAEATTKTGKKWSIVPQRLKRFLGVESESSAGGNASPMPTDEDAFAGIVPDSSQRPEVGPWMQPPAANERNTADANGRGGETAEGRSRRYFVFSRSRPQQPAEGETADVGNGNNQTASPKSKKAVFGFLRRGGKRSEQIVPLEVQ